MPAIAQDSCLIAQVEDLVEPMAHEQDRDPTVAQAPNDREESLDLMRG